MSKILYKEQDGVQILKFIGEVRVTLSPTISTFLQALRSKDYLESMIIDLSRTEMIDSTALGLIAKIGIFTREQFGVLTTIISPRQDITRVLGSMFMEKVCFVSNEFVADPGRLKELNEESLNDEKMRVQVLEAHKTLMMLDNQNFDKFQDLVKALESEQEFEIL